MRRGPREIKGGFLIRLEGEEKHTLIPTVE